MSIDAFEKRDEIFKLRSKLELAEASRVSAEATFTIEESRQKLVEIYERKV